jgi:hypothetical protein
MDVRGPDHPHQVGKAPVEGDTTVMGSGSLNFAVPAMGKRGKPATSLPKVDSTTVLKNSDIQKMIHDFEMKDDAFMMNEEYDGPRDGMVFKDGAQGIGYYTDVSLPQMWEDR